MIRTRAIIHHGKVICKLYSVNCEELRWQSDKDDMENFTKTKKSLRFSLVGDRSLHETSYVQVRQWRPEERRGSQREGASLQWRVRGGSFQPPHPSLVPVTLGLRVFLWGGEHSVLHPAKSSLGSPSCPSVTTQTNPQNGIKFNLEIALQWTGPLA